MLQIEEKKEFVGSGIHLLTRIEFNEILHSLMDLSLLFLPFRRKYFKN